METLLENLDLIFSDMQITLEEKDYLETYQNKIFSLINKESKTFLFLNSDKILSCVLILKRNNKFVISEFISILEKLDVHLKLIYKK